MSDLKFKIEKVPAMNAHDEVWRMAFSELPDTPVYELYVQVECRNIFFQKKYKWGFIGDFSSLEAAKAEISQIRNIPHQVKRLKEIQKMDPEVVYEE